MSNSHLYIHIMPSINFYTMLKFKLIRGKNIDSFKSIIRACTTEAMNFKEPLSIADINYSFERECIECLWIIV